MKGYSTNGHVDFEPEYKYITGYHGTTRNKANTIVASSSFRISNTPTNWLGKGIYFYKYYVDAAKWQGVKTGGDPIDTVIHVVVKVKYDDYIDLETPEGKALFNGFLERAKYDGLEPDTPQKNQCAIMNMIWEKIPHIKAIGGAFSPERSSDFKTLNDTRSKRREFCIRDNESILTLERMPTNEV